MGSLKSVEGCEAWWNEDVVQSTVPVRASASSDRVLVLVVAKSRQIELDPCKYGIQVYRMAEHSLDTGVPSARRP